jgi:hypothetical protein
LAALLFEAGFREVTGCETWPASTDALVLWMATIG